MELEIEFTICIFISEVFSQSIINLRIWKLCSIGMKIYSGRAFS